MRFSGYRVCAEEGKVVLERSDFDETDLDPDTNWTEAWQNQDEGCPVKGFIELEKALVCAAKILALQAARALSPEDLVVAQEFCPVWDGQVAEIASIDQLLTR